MKQFLSGTAIAGIDQRAHIDIAGGDDAVKRRPHLLEALQILQAHQVSLCGTEIAARRRDGFFESLQIGRLRLVLRLILIVFLA